MSRERLCGDAVQALLDVGLDVVRGDDDAERRPLIGSPRIASASARRTMRLARPGSRRSRIRVKSTRSILSRCCCRRTLNSSARARGHPCRRPAGDPQHEVPVVVGNRLRFSGRASRNGVGLVQGVEQASVGRGSLGWSDCGRPPSTMWVHSGSSRRTRVLRVEQGQPMAEDVVVHRRAPEAQAGTAVVDRCGRPCSTGSWRIRAAGERRRAGSRGAAPSRSAPRRRRRRSSSLRSAALVPRR